MLKPLSLLLIVAGLALGPVYWVYIMHFTGRLAQSVPLQAGPTGAWSSHAFRLSPDMGPVGLILRVDGIFSPNMPDDQPPVDRYSAILHQDEDTAAPIPLVFDAGSVTNNNPQFRERLALLKAPQAGAYRLEVTPAGTPVIRLQHVQLDIRSQVREADYRLVAAGIALLGLGVLGLLL